MIVLISILESKNLDACILLCIQENLNMNKYLYIDTYKYASNRGLTPQSGTQPLYYLSLADCRSASIGPILNIVTSRAIHVRFSIKVSNLLFWQYITSVAEISFRQMK